MEQTNKQQTAVEWLIDRLTSGDFHTELPDEDVFGIWGYAMQMEQEQIEQAYGDGLNGHRTDFCNRNEYYQQTYQTDKP